MNSTTVRSSIGSMARCSSTSSSRIASRSLSTSTIRCTDISPHSPRFIDVPQPPQPRVVVPGRIRGKLPTPRDIWKIRGQKDKTDPKFIEQALPEPVKPKFTAKDPRAAWKRTMFETRKRNLKEGLQELHQRRIDSIASMERKSRRKIDERNKILYGPPREDEVLTSPTIKEALKWLQHGSVPDPDREARVADKVARVQNRETEKELERRDALHSLYMHARNFITTEEQLDAKVEELFVKYPFMNSTGQVSENIWDVNRAPPATRDLMLGVQHNEQIASKFYGGAGTRNANKLRKIAEELTGGKMDSDL